MRPLQSWLARALPFYYGWVIFGSGIGVSFSSRALMSLTTLSVFPVPMTEEFGWLRDFFSGAVSLGGLCAVFLSPFAGRIIDRYGSGVVLAIISTIAGICGIGLSLISQQWMFYALYIPGRAVFAGPLELGISTAISNWFIHRRTFALALLSIWQGIGLADAAVSPGHHQWLGLAHQLGRAGDVHPGVGSAASLAVDRAVSGGPWI